MAAMTMGSEGVRRRSAVCVLVLVVCFTSSVSSLRRSFQPDQQNTVRVSYFPNSQHNFEFRAQLSEAELRQQELDILQLKNDLDSLSPDVVQHLDLLQNGLEQNVFQVRRKRDVTQLSTAQEVTEAQTGVLINFITKVTNVNLDGHLFALNSTSGNPEMFEVTTGGELKLRDGYHLDYEVESMRSINFVVHATNPSVPSDVYEISATLTVTNVNEPPVFETQPQPYFATVRTDTGSGYTIITLVATDPEGQTVQYEKTSVSPNTYNNRIELRTLTINGVYQCQLRTVGSGTFVPEGQTISITVSARDATSGGQVVTTTVGVLIGVRPPQFYQSSYQGSMLENNLPQQTVYKLGTSEELRVEWKTFQTGTVSLSLTREGGVKAENFTVQRNDNHGYIICTKGLDYEEANPKTQALTLTATQRVGNVFLSSSVALTVEIQDTNDNRPVFGQSQYLKSIPENTAISLSVLEVMAKDKDTGLNAQIEYSLVGTEDFDIVTSQQGGNPPTYKGVIRVKRNLDYDQASGPYYSFQVKATDRGTPPQTSLSNVRISVTNVNDENPQFLNPPHEVYEVQENAGVNQFITQVLATDRDGDKVTYSFTNGGLRMEKFQINRTSGLLTLAQTITADDDRFTLTVKATDDGSCCGGSTSLSSTITIYVQVYGTNSERPDFTGCSQYNPSIDENSASGTSVWKVTAEDNDRGPNGVVSYSLTQSGDVFSINQSSGLIAVNANIDREVTPFVQVTVKAKDGGTPPLEGYCMFRVTVNDVNDNSPLFEKASYKANITFSMPIQVPFIFVRANDDDVGNNARITYSLPNNAEGKFSIIPENGYISLTQALGQADAGQSYSLTAMAKDEGSPSPLNTTVSVLVNVVAGDKKPPQWDQNYNLRTYNVDETVRLGFEIIKNMTCDSMIPDKNVEFQLIRADGTTGTKTEFFQLRQNGNSVDVLATGKFDYTKAEEHIIGIRCLSYGSVPLMNETNPKVELIDTNNQIPEFQGLGSDGRYSATVQENKDPNTTVVTVEATDKDSTYPFNSVTFSLIAAGDAENFTIGPGSKPNTAIIRTRYEFDRETKEYYYLTVKAEDGAPSSLPGTTNSSPNTATVVINVKITDVNDNPPYFEKPQYAISVQESTYINDLIEPPIEVKDPDASDRGRHTYRIISGNTNNAFGIRNGLGNLFPLRKLDYEGSDKTFNLVVEASDGLYSASTMVTVTVLDVNDNNPVFDKDVYTVNDFSENDNNVPRALITINASDADVDRPNEIRYSLEGSSFNVNEYFRIDSRTGELFINKPLDRDLPNGRSNWQFTVKAADERTNPNFGYAGVSVMPKDLNDNKPEFITDPLEASVREGSDRGSLVVQIRAEDMDYENNGTVEFFITNIVDGANVNRTGYFLINKDTGVVNTNVEGDFLDRETQDTYRLTIQLKDKGNPPMENQGVLIVTLSDVNDEWPVFQEKIYRTEMSENLQSGEVIRVVAKDNDIGDNANVFYSLVDSTNHFSVRDIDNEGSVQVVLPVNYEDPNQRSFNLTVRAQDINSNHKDTCYVEITVLDFNDNAPDIQPDSLRSSVAEDAPPGTVIANFTATDADSTDINKEFEFSISRASNPRRHFSIDSVGGQVKVRRRLDRETQAVHELTILAIDKGSPPLTGNAKLTVIVEDVNDNYPTFLEDYNPHVQENKDEGVEREVQEVFAKDPDAVPYGAPFGFELAPTCGADCDKFSFMFYPDRAGGNGTATVSTNKQFDREAKKYYLIPIIMWDMRDKNSRESMTGTNTLTITIGDENDERMKAGTQDIFVYNYKGQFGPLEIGRVYVEDADDWDLPDKTFNYTGADWMKNYFTVDYETGMVTMKKGVPNSPDRKPYTFTVRVYDKKWKDTVVSTVSVTVEELSEEAVRNSGATRFKGTSAEEFIRIPKPTNSERNPKSSFQTFHELLANKLNTDKENVQIISVQDVEGGFTDVRYSVHGSPYYPSSQSDSVVVMNKKEFEDKLLLTVDEVPIDACQEEVFEGGCYNYMDITGNPAMVNSNGTSFVGVEVFIRAMEGCRALDFPEPNECSGDYCYHGGTCVKNDFGVLSCTNCSEGFDGPRCQQLRHSFDGNNYAMYPTLEQCENSETSIEFITTQMDGQLLYNGPMTPPAADKPQDFISLQLSGGMPVLHIDHGSGSATLSLDGKDKDGGNVINSLSDGKWHKIDIVRKGKFVEMTVDDCLAAGPSGSENQVPDTRPCQISATTQGENSFLNVATLLQLGGRAPGHTFPIQGHVVSNTGFNGCVRNLIHNSKYYDLHYKMIPEVPSGENGCPREDKLCLDDSGNPKCGDNGICIASFDNTSPATCLCKPRWRGTLCTEATEVRDLQRESFMQWRVKNDAQLLPYHLEVQVMYRTWDTDGVLFTVSTPDNTKRVTMELKDGHLQALYNLGNQDNILLLNHMLASDGYWHLAKFKRVMHVATLTLDQGEGRNHASRRDLQDNMYMGLTSTSPLYGGASVTNPSGAQVLDRDLSNTCFQDVRLNGVYLPIKSSENSLDTVAEWVDERNIKDGCTRPDGCVPPPVCPLYAVCVNLWGHGECRCAPGYHELDNGACESDCLPENPCFMNSPCYITDEGSVGCNCTLPWRGPLCNIYPSNEKGPNIGIAGSTIAAIVVSIIVLLLLVLLAFFLVTYYMRKKNRDDFDKFVVEEDADFDIRENVMFYDEEGAGEEDQNAFDLAKLPNHDTETMIPPVEMVPLSREQPRGRRAPDDRPDVGDVLHDRMHDADDDPDAPPHDTLIAFNEEGAGSDAGSLSSLGSSSSDASQDYDYLNNWGPKFAKLADMYGTGGQE